MQQTKVPDNWIITTLGELGKFDKGRGLPGESMTGNEVCTDGCNIPCIGYGDIYMKYNISFDKAKNFTTAEAIKTSKKISKGTLLFTATGETAMEIGKCVCYRGDEDIYVGGDIIIFNNDKVLPEFLAYQQYINDLIKIKSSWAQGHSVVHIREKNLSKLPVKYPVQLAEQQKIVEVLDVWQTAIALQIQFMKKLKEQKKSLMQKLLTPKAGWKEFKLRALCNKMQSGGTPKADNALYYGGNIPFVKIDDITKAGKYLRETTTTLTDAGLKNSSAWQIPAGSLLYSMYASIGFPIITECVVTTSQAIMGICVDETKISTEFLYYYLTNYQPKMAKYIEKGTQGNLNAKLVGDIPVLTPNRNEQNRIAEILSSIDEHISLVLRQVGLINLQQKYLLENLLTGKIRVNA